jgi:hypothetical protein
VRERVEPAVGPEGVLPLVEADRPAPPAVGGEPRLEDGGLGVDDEAVEVEDDGGDPRGQAAPSSAPRGGQRRDPGLDPLVDLDQELGVVVAGFGLGHGGIIGDLAER